MGHEGGFDPYAAPVSSGHARPAVIRWYRIYAAAMTMLSLLLLALGVRALVASGDTAASIAVTRVVVATFLAGLYGVATFVPWRPWGWTWALVAIAVGVVGGLFFFAVPLLVFWFKPNVKAAFMRL